MNIRVANCSPVHRVLGIAVILMTGSMVLLQLLLPDGLQLRCRFHALTGWPCPTCGTSRCASLLLDGSLGEAFRIQPLLFCGMLLMLPLIVYMLPALFLNWPIPRIRLERKQEKYGLIAGMLLIVAANWIYLILHQT